LPVYGDGVPSANGQDYLRQPHFDAVLAEMNAEHQSLSRSLLGGDAEPGAARPLPAFRRPRG
jgi:hypothetical protein